MLTLYLAEGGVGIISGGNTAGEYCNLEVENFLKRISTHNVSRTNSSESQGR